jgi:hypothetical protein
LLPLQFTQILCAGLARVGIRLGSEVVVIEQPKIGLDEVKNPLETCVFRHLIIQPTGCCEIPIVVVDAVKALARHAGSAEGVTKLSRAAPKCQRLTIRRTVASFEGQASLQRSLAFLGDNIIYAAVRLRALESSARAAKNFDPLDVFRRQMGKIKSAQRRAVSLDAVDENQNMIRLRAANEYRCRVTTGPGLNDI